MSVSVCVCVQKMLFVVVDDGVGVIIVIINQKAGKY